MVKAVKKRRFSQIAPAGPGLPKLTDQLVGVTDGTADNLYTVQQVKDAIGGGGSALTLTDGTHAVANVGQITVTGATVGGTTPNATLEITGGASPADPTATAGPTAVDGSAGTFMRSDAAPAVQVATTGRPGLVQPDGSTITIDGQVISSVIVIDGTEISGGSTGFALTVGQDGKVADTAVRAILTADANFYVDSAGGSDSNPGTALLPFATLDYAWLHLSSIYDLAQFTLTIHLVGAGPYELEIDSGWIGGIAVNIIGDGSTVTNISTVGIGRASSFTIGPTINVDSVSLGGGGADYGVISYAFGAVVLGNVTGDIAFGAVNIYHIYMVNPGCVFNMTGNVAVNGGAQAFYSVSSLAFIGTTASISLNGIPNFGIAFAFVVENGLLEPQDVYAGAATGLRFAVASNGQINPIDTSPTYLPGSSAGYLFDGIYSGLPSQVIYTPSTGDTIDVNPGQPDTLIAPATALASLTLALPFLSAFGSVFSGYVVRFSSTEFIAALSFTTSDGSTVVAPPVSLPAGGGGALIYDANSNSWYPLYADTPGLTTVTGNLTFYVETTGSDSNPGTSGAPWATLQHVFDFLSSTYIFADVRCTVNIGAGSFVGFGIKGILGTGFINFVGAGSTQTTITAGPNDDVFNTGECWSGYAFSAVVTVVDGVTFDVSACPSGISGINLGVPALLCLLGNFSTFSTDIAFAGSIVGNCYIALTAPVDFQVLPKGGGTGVTLPGGESCQSVFSISNAAQFLDYSTWQIVGGALACSFTFAIVQGAATYFSNGASYSGTATGSAFDIIGNSSAASVAGPGTMGPNYFPNNAPGTCDASSSYDGFPFAQQQSGPPTAANLDQGAYAVFKDNTQPTGSGVTIDYNDSGTLVTFSPGRTLLQADATRYVNSATGSDSYNGQSATFTGGLDGPYFSLQHFVDQVSSTLDTGGFTVTGSVAAGDYAGFGAKPIVGGGVIYVVGAGPDATFVDAGPNDGVYNFGESISWYVFTGANWFLDEVTLQNSDGNNLLSAYNFPNTLFLGPPDESGGNVNGILNVGDFANFTSASTFEDAGSNITISGNGESLYHIEEAASTFLTGNYTFSATPNFSAAVFWSDLAGNTQLEFASFSGPVSGSLYHLTWGGILNTIMVGPLSISGASPGDSDGSGIYAFVDVSNGLAIGDVVAGLFNVSDLPPGFVTRGNIMVIDSTVPAAGNFGVLVVGGGNNIVPVWSDGTSTLGVPNWYIG